MSERDAINAYLTELVHAPSLPTEREIATNLPVLITALGEIGADLGRAARSALDAQERLFDIVAKLAVSTPLLSGAAIECHKDICRSADGPRKLVEAVEAVHNFAAGIAAEMNRLEEKTNGKRDRQPHTTMRFFRTICQQLAHMNMGTSLPLDSDQDEADKFPLFRIAKLGLTLAAKRETNLQKLADAVLWSQLTLLRHLKKARSTK